VLRPFPALRIRSLGPKYIYIDAFRRQSVTRKTLLRYTLNSILVNNLISVTLWKKLSSEVPWFAERPVYDVGRAITGNFQMASIFSHAVAALGIGACFYQPRTPKRAWVLGVLCSVIPDVDVIGFPLGIRYGDFWGHRGFTHSLLFAALLASLALLLAFRQAVPGLSRFALWMYFFLATASHGFLDAMTDGGLGVAFFSPFNNARYFLPWRPIRVSPIGISRFFTHGGLVVIQTELLWIWLPAALLMASAWLIRRRVALSR